MYIIFDIIAIGFFFLSYVLWFFSPHCIRLIGGIRCVHRTVSKFIYEFFYNNSGVFQAIETILVFKC